MVGESYTDQISGGAINTSDVGLNSQTSATTITLTNPAKRIQRITMTAASQQLRMPPADVLSNGTDFVVDNVGANAFDITTNDGATVIVAAATGSGYLVYVVDNGTEQGTWQGRALAGGGASSGANSDITSLLGLTTPLTPAQGGTGIDGSATGGSAQYVKQESSGGNFTIGTIPVGDYPTMTGDSGSGGTKGAVPAPGSGDASNQKFLKADGTWTTPSGTGAAASETYVTMGNSAGLSAERALTAGTGVSITDGGADSTVTINVSNAVPATSGNALAFVRVNSAATGLEYRTPQQSIDAISQMTTRGDIITHDGSNVVRKALGASKTVLQSDGSDPVYSLVAVDNMATGVGAFETGDTCDSFRASKTGWVLLDGRTIGSAASGATNRANADTEDLFTVLWNQLADAQAAVSGGRGVSASADFAADKTLTLPDASGHARAGRDNMSGTSRNNLTSALNGDTLGASGGAETHSLTGAQNGPHNHDYLATPNNTTAVQTSGSANVSGQTTAQTSTSGSGTAHNNTQPTLIMNVFIKL